MKLFLLPSSQFLLVVFRMAYVAALLSCTPCSSSSSLAPQFVTHRFGNPSAAHTLELYLDLICPFSMKQVRRSLFLPTSYKLTARSSQLTGVREHVLPLLVSNAEVASKLQIILRQTPQPWHRYVRFYRREAFKLTRNAARRRWFTKLLSPRRALLLGRARASPTAILESSASSRSSSLRSWMDKRFVLSSSTAGLG